VRLIETVKSPQWRAATVATRRWWMSSARGRAMRAGALAIVVLAALPHAGHTAPQASGALQVEGGAYHVYPGEEIQEALDAAARSATTKLVKVHQGTYRPDSFRQALIWLNAAHDGITLEAVGDVTLTAANPALVGNEHHTAVVNHVIYIGDGIGNATVLRGFRITGADNFTTMQETDVIEPNTELAKTIFFYVDGGGIKIYGRSYPTLERIEVVGNYTSPCGGGVSIEHHGEGDGYVVIRDSIFRNNSTQVTGSAVDLLPGSRARITNSLFVGNVANTGVDYVSWYNRIPPYNGEHGSGALTVFNGSHVIVTRSTFTDNWNGVDDRSTGSRYIDSIFWHNDRGGGISPGARYELDISDGSGVQGSFINGEIDDLQGTIPRATNTFDAPDPQFDVDYVPRAPEYLGVGYRRPPAAHLAEG
jgi:hypothetical protein